MIRRGAWRSSAGLISVGLSVLAVGLAGCASASDPSGAERVSSLGPAHGAGPQNAGGSANGAAAPPPSVGTATDACKGEGRGKTYEVGPGRDHEALADVPFESLGPGDTVRVYPRPLPYREKLMISGYGTVDAPIRVCGMIGPDGSRPIIDGDGATTRPTLQFPYDGHQVRGVVIIGHKNPDPIEKQPSYLVFSGFEVRGGLPGKPFTNKAGKPSQYSQIVSGIFLERGNHVLISNNVVHGNGTGLFLGTGGSDAAVSRDLRVAGNHIHGNGTDRHFEHNMYSEVLGLTVEFNRFDSPRRSKDGVLGANLKDRSAGTVIRFNTFEDGAHILDLVEAQETRETTMKEPSYRQTWVYGNTLIRGREASGSMVHFGGDSGELTTYRDGVLHFEHNTVVIQNSTHQEWSSVPVFEMNIKASKIESRNNLYFAEEPNKPATRPVALLGLRDGVISGTLSTEGDWFSKGFRAFDGTEGRPVDNKAEVRGFEAAATGVDPGFNDKEHGDYRLRSLLPVTLAAPASDVSFTFRELGKPEPRSADDRKTPGAFGLVR